MIAETLVATPNYNSRKGKPVRLIVLHADASPDERATREWIQNPASKVSYHLEVERDGTVIRYVMDIDRAWAVGVATWRGVTDLNTISLSASFANRNDKTSTHPGESLTDIQIATMREIVERWRRKIPTIEAVTTHAAVAMPVGRKTDPLGAANFRLEDYQ